MNGTTLETCLLFSVQSRISRTPDKTKIEYYMLILVASFDVAVGIQVIVQSFTKYTTNFTQSYCALFSGPILLGMMGSNLLMFAASLAFYWLLKNTAHDSQTTLEISLRAC